jgi:DNA-binding transcriptional regulator YdaS (Cro superfamily)
MLIDGESDVKTKFDKDFLKIKDFSRNKGIEEAIQIAGSQIKLAEILRVSQPAIHYMLYSKHVTAERAIEIETKIGVSRASIRPDLFKND